MRRGKAIPVVRPLNGDGTYSICVLIDFLEKVFALSKTTAQENMLQKVSRE
jgi:hypothetical protein